MNKQTGTKLAVFDCDGTLVDGQAAVCGAMQAAFQTVGLPAPPDSATRRIVGLSLPVAIRHLAPDAEAGVQSELVAAYRAAFFATRSSGKLEEPLFAGIAELLHALHGAGWTLGVATGKSDRGLQGCLATHGLSGLFTTLQTADHHPSKPHPSMIEQAMADAGATPDATVMIGDTRYDIEMALNAGVRALGVAWGYHPPEELVAAGAAAVAESAAQLQVLIDG